MPNFVSVIGMKNFILISIIHDSKRKLIHKDCHKKVFIVT